MLIRMTVDLQGYSARSDGTTFEWPKRGAEIDLDDAHAQELIHQGYAIPVRSAAVETTRRPADDEEQRMVSAATVFTRPPASVEVSADDEIVTIGDTPESEPPVEPIRRGPGRPRKV